MCYIHVSSAILALSLVVTEVSAQNTVFTETVSYPRAEYHAAKLILMHEPKDELFVGMIHPAAALFREHFYVNAAAAEHAAYRKLLNEQDAQIVTLREVLLRGCLDERGEVVEGSELEELRAFSGKFLIYTCDEGVDTVEQQAYKTALLKKLHPLDLIKIILLQPEVKLAKTSINTGLEASYVFKPMMNLFFMRDPMITTARGVVMGRMNSSQRRMETDVIEFGLRKLGIPPIANIEGEGAFLEGGDYIPFGNFDFIGCGLRTTMPAIEQLMVKDVLGKDTLVVVHDNWRSQEQMHLDIYFNVIDKDLVTMCSNRYQARPGDRDFVRVDVYAKNDKLGGYHKVIVGQSLLTFLMERGIDIIPISKEDEANLANNYLCVDARKIAMVTGQSSKLKNALTCKGVEVLWVKLDNLIKGYGAAHCMTQVLKREKR